MKTLNTYYSSNENLNKFIQDNDIKDSSKLLIQVFTSENNYTFIETLLKNISTYFPLASLIGSTTDGEINNGFVSTKKTVISFTRFENVKLKTYITNEFENYFEAGKKIATELIDDNTKVIISFIDGLLCNGEEYLNGISNINKNIIVAGGLAADNGEFKQTYVFTKNHIYQDGIVGISLSSLNLTVFTDYSFNWLPIGQKLKITKADKNRVYTINDKTAVDTYNYYLGKSISEQLPAIGIEFPLIIEKNDVCIARAVIAKNNDGSLVFAGNLNEGDQVRFGYGNIDAILDKTQSHINKLNNQKMESIFIYSCMARRRFMPEKVENETLIYNQIAPTCGFYTYGEFFSNKSSKLLLNQSMTILALSESNEINTKKISVKIEKDVSTTIQALSHLINVSTKELEQKDKIMISQSRNIAMGDMLNIIAHQWRQPLNIISMSANNILIDIELDDLDKEKTKDYINSILKQSSKLSKIIDNFKSYFKPMKNKEEFLIETLIKEIKDIISLNLEENKIVFKIKNQLETSIYTYKTELLQVLLNLINNSKEALLRKEKDTKLILLLIKEDEQYIIFEIHDNAGGIENSILDEIFDPYFSTKQELNGTGLGLYINKIIIEKYLEGEISVKNNQEGASFNIKIKKI
jgi:nitrogen-specific signal transduction histidine kinase